MLENREGEIPYVGFSGNRILVRRPIETENGLVHKMDEFLEEELESERALMERRMKNFFDLSPKGDDSNMAQMALPLNEAN